MTRSSTAQLDLAPSGPGRLAAGVLILAALTASEIGRLQKWSVGESVPTDPGKIALATERIDPNHATFASLVRLSGIGPVRAERIIQYRAGKTPPAFAGPDDLDDVFGIGPGTIKKIAPFLSFPRKPRRP